MINYKLAKEIGATHHIDRLLYKFNDDGLAMCYFSEYGWEKAENDAAHMAELNKINFDKAKPRTRTEYEKVTESIFDLRDEFERGELYSKHRNKEKYYQINTEAWVVSAMSNSSLYRKTEKEVDERQEFVDAAIEYSYYTGSTETELILLESMYDSGKFRLAGVNGELD